MVMIVNQDEWKLEDSKEWIVRWIVEDYDQGNRKRNGEVGDSG